MPKKSAPKTTVADVATVENSMVANNVAVEKNMYKEEIKEVETKIVAEPLEDSDEIDVVSLIPNVSYKDGKTGDMYQWDEVGHVELMTFETLKNLWRNHKGYFRDMALKPNDDRVIKKLGLTKTYEKYEFLMDESNYTRANIKELCEAISSTPNGLKYSIVNKVKDMVVAGELTDIKVIQVIEKHFNVDLTSLLD